jgi:hypothetical protein
MVANVRHRGTREIGELMSAVRTDTLNGPAAAFKLRGRRLTVSFVIAAVACAAILFHFHDRSWWPPDEGAYAHVAERILAGDVLNLDVQDIHAGYVNFANALVFAVFGDSLVSLRYPLLAMGLIQAGAVFVLFAGHGAAAAIIAAIALTTFSFIQFPNPTAHWYAFFLLVMTMACLALWPRGSAWRLWTLGFIVGTLFLFRQLSGVIVAIAVTSYLILETANNRDRPTEERGLIGRGLALIMAVGLGGYLYARVDAFAFVVFGVWPLAMLAWMSWFVRAPDRELWRVVALLICGGAAACVPLVVNGIFWAVMPVLPLVLGVVVVRSLIRMGPHSAAFHPIPFLAAFYAVVSVHYQIPIYLMYSSGATVVGLLWLVVSARGRWHAPTLALTAFIVIVGLVFHAGQSPSRRIHGIIAGTRTQQVPCDGLDRCGLKITPDSLGAYRRISELIEQHSRPDDAVLAIPVNPEIYYLGRRRNPVRFFNSALGLPDERALDDTLRTLERDPPRLVFYQPDDKYNTVLSRRLMAGLRERYTLLETIGEIEIYLSKP